MLDELVRNVEFLELSVLERHVCFVPLPAWEQDEIPQNICLKDYAFAPDHGKYLIGLIPVG